MCRSRGRGRRADRRSGSEGGGKNESDVSHKAKPWQHARDHGICGRTSTNLVVDEGSEGQIVEEVCEVLPHIGIAVLSQALVVEAVDLSNLPRLVVASQDGDALAIPHLESDEEGDRLDRVVASVDVIAHEEVIRVWGVAANAEQLGQVVELAVDVTAYCDGAPDSLDVRLLQQDFPCLMGGGREETSERAVG